MCRTVIGLKSKIVCIEFTYLRKSDIDGHCYIILDEIQLVDDWQRLVLELFEGKDCDLYISGSDSAMLSGNLSGRSADVEVFPFSYREFLDYTGEEDSDGSVREYMEYGGFPLAAAFRSSEDSRISVLDGILSTAVMRDITGRNVVRNADSFTEVSRFLAGSMGDTLSPNSVADRLSDRGIRVSYDAVCRYTGYLERSLMFSKAERYDVKAGKVLAVGSRTYLVDPGLMIPILGKRKTDTDSTMECLVYLELRRRGYRVQVGCIGDLEIDFVATNGSDRLYIQVCYSMNSENTRERELRPLRKLNDGYRKLVVTMDGSLNSDYDGIREVGLREFLLDDMQ